MARTAKRIPGVKQLGFQDQFGMTTAPCVPAIREAVRAWREGKYKGVTATTRELLNYWFLTDHLTPNGRRFCYYDAQREAVETLIYVCQLPCPKGRGLFKASPV